MIEKILITGATGFLGSCLANRLCERYEVIAIGRSRSKAQKLLDSKVTFISFDFGKDSFDSIKDQLKGISYIVHCAGKTAPFGTYSSFYDANILSTQKTIDLCSNLTIKKFVNISSPSIYFSKEDRVNIKETDELPRKQFNYYGETKLAADQLLLKAHVDLGLPVVTIRPRLLIGEGDTTFLPRLLSTKIMGKTPLLNGGKSLHNFTYIENVLDSIELCLKSSDHCHGEVYNITNGESISVIDFYEKAFLAYRKKASFIKIPYKLINFYSECLEKIYTVLKIDSEPKISRYGVNLFAFSQTLDISKARDELGYRPKITIDEGLAIMTKNISKT